MTGLSTFKTESTRMLTTLSTQLDLHAALPRAAARSGSVRVGAATYCRALPRDGLHDMLPYCCLPRLGLGHVGGVYNLND